MSELIIIGYDDPTTARRACEQVQALQQSFVVELRGLAVVDIDVDAEGKSHVDTPRQVTGPSAVSGALWGLLFGVLFLVPGLGLLGGALGAIFGKLGQSGIDDTKGDDVRRRPRPQLRAVGYARTATGVRRTRLRRMTRGPFEWDLKRYLASLVVLARDTGLPKKAAMKAVTAGLRSYRAAIARYATASELEIWYDVVTADEMLTTFGPEEREKWSARLERRANKRTNTGTPAS